VRDAVLEIRAINAWGRVVRAGVRVVKNAAGYDMPKLYTGSRGTLVFITSVTFMARPLPDEVCHLSYTASTSGRPSQPTEPRSVHARPTSRHRGGPAGPS